MVGCWAGARGGRRREEEEGGAGSSLQMEEREGEAGGEEDEIKCVFVHGFRGKTIFRGI